MSAIHIAAALGGMALCGAVGFIFGWLQGHVEAARQQAERALATRSRRASVEADKLEHNDTKG